MKSIFSNLRILAMVLLFSSAVYAGYAQEKPSTGQEYPLIKAEGPPPDPATDKVCKYFIYSKYWTTAQRVAFSYTKGSDEGNDNPRLTNLTYRIDESKTVPTVHQKGVDPNANPKWVVSMSQAEYDANKNCLVGIQPEK